jgi:putative glutathione S-transferase
VNAQFPNEQNEAGKFKRQDDAFGGWVTVDGSSEYPVARIVDYPNLFGYLKDLYQREGIADTVNFDHFKRHYYMTHEDINPTRIVPIGPVQDFTAPHGRGHLN